MHITPPQDTRPLEPLASRPTRRRRLIRPMLVGSLLLHLLFLAGFFLFRPEDTAQPPPANSDEVAMVFDSPTGLEQASTPSPDPSPKPSTAAGNPDAPVTPPTPETASAPPPPPLAAAVAPESQPSVTAETVPTPEAPPPVTETPPPEPTPTPPAPTPPATVSLSQDEPIPPPPPAFQVPQPPPPLPPLPARPSPPRVASRPAPRNPSAFPMPQNWSFNAAPSQQAPGRPSRGFDMSVANQGGPSATSLGYVRGAKPSGDWMSALRRWVDARKYYPEQAIVQREQGAVTLLIDIDRTGRVLSVQLADSSRSQFLDGAFQDLFRRANVPPFTPDMTDQTTTLRATMNFRLIMH